MAALHRGKWNRALLCVSTQIASVVHSGKCQLIGEDWIGCCLFSFLFIYSCTVFAASLGFCLSMADNSLSSEYCVCSYQSDSQTFSGLYQDFQGSDKWIMNSKGNDCRLSFHDTHQPLTNLCLTQKQAINNDGIIG